jgi:hypothetical protein
VDRRLDWLPGALLITVGVVLLAAQQLAAGWEVIVLAIGLVFLVAYAATRLYGLLIPAAILCGIGVGIVLQHRAPLRETVVAGLAVGFLAIYAVDRVMTGARRRWWPLIPGLILLVVAIEGGALGPEGERAVDVFWPVALIAAGALLLLRARARRID